ncbi:hypothetical protein A5777_17920 [Gordonia sp. 852002-10350_SCH5691597]|nr:hypothetical protein A5777_17920 [Gordonia sp. 852002-10350_SCH5691597]
MLPTRADLLNQRERAAVVEIVNALLDARERDNAVEATTEQDASSEEDEEQKTFAAVTVRYGPNQPQPLTLVTTVRGANEADAVGRVAEALQMLGYEVRRQVDVNGVFVDVVASNLNEVVMIEVVPHNRTSIESMSQALKGAALESEADDQFALAARDTGGISEGEQTRRDMDQQGEAPDPDGPEDGA